MSFDRLARGYSQLEWFLAGRKLQVCRTAFLREALEAESILLVGEGHGRFLLELCRAAPEKPICYVDASVQMLRVARKRLERAGLNSAPVEFHCTPILQFETTRRVDLIATQFFLDCFDAEELRDVVRRLARLLAPEGRWVIADFQVPPCGWRRQRARLILKLAYSFFRLATKLPAQRLVPPQQLLRENDLRLERRSESNFGLLYAELWKAASAMPRRRA
jgi:ubiquinone/menaquinone biosynthesis C-methylase UbiE